MIAFSYGSYGMRWLRRDGAILFTDMTAMGGDGTTSRPALLGSAGVSKLNRAISAHSEDTIEHA